MEYLPHPSELDQVLEWYLKLGYFLNTSKYLYWINLTTFFLYFIDKLLSVMGCRSVRIPEFWLLVVSGLGGAPSAMLAAWIFNHKTKKVSYRRSFNSIIIFHIVLVCIPYFCGKNYTHVYSQLVMPISKMKGTFGALYYYLPFYGVTIAIYYTLGAFIALLQIIFSPIIFVINLAVLLMRMVLLAGFIGVALTLALSIYQNPDDTYNYLSQQWNSGMEMLMKL